MTSTGEFRKRIDKNLGFPVDNKKIKTEFKIYLELLTGIKPLQKALNKIKLLPNPYFSDYEWKILRSTLRLLPELESQLKSLLQENKLSDFSEISLAALKSFGNYEDKTKEIATCTRWIRKNYQPGKRFGIIVPDLKNYRSLLHPQQTSVDGQKVHPVSSNPRG